MELNTASVGTLFFGSPDKYLSNILIFPFNLWALVSGTSDKLYIRNNLIKARVDAGYDPDPTVDEYVAYGKDVSKNMLFYLGSIKYPYSDDKFYHRSGYTKMKLFLPFLGFVDLSPNDFIGTYEYVSIILSIDIKTGNATYIVCSATEPLYSASTTIITTEPTDEKCRIVSVHTFKLGMEVPIGSTNATEIGRNIMLGFVKAGVGIGSSLVSKNIGAGITTSASVVSGVEKTMARDKQYSTSQHKWGVDARTKLKEVGAKNLSKTTNTTYDSSAHFKGKIVNECFEGFGSAISSVFMTGESDKPNNINSLINCSRHCFLQVFTPKMKSDTNYAELYGKPLGEVRRIGDMHGYTEVAKVHIQGDAFKKATREEIGMLGDALSDGIILPRTTPTN